MPKRQRKIAERTDVDVLGKLEGKPAMLGRLIQRRRVLEVPQRCPVVPEPSIAAARPGKGWTDGR